MNTEAYPFTVKPLPYEYDALIPVLDAQTLCYHHDKHYRTYVENLNKALSGYPELQTRTLKELLAMASFGTMPAGEPGADLLPEDVRISIHNNGGGVYNHALYFDSMRCPVGQRPWGKLQEAIIGDYGSYADWKAMMTEAAMSQFGSGWAWLLKDKSGKLTIRKTPNQDIPDLETYTPIFLIDVWEHAYYLQYKNRRIDYVNGWFSLIDWKKAEERYIAQE